MAFHRGHKAHPKSQHIEKKTPRSLETIRANIFEIPCETSQELNGNCSEKLLQMIFLFWVTFFGWLFLP